MERARVFERLGCRDEAAANYAFVADAWRTADAELQPWVREAHDAMARLGGRRDAGRRKALSVRVGLSSP